MICEFRNKLEIYNCYVMNLNTKYHVKKETYLNEVIATIIITVVVTILFVWWVLPMKLLSSIINKFINKLNLNRKFVCSKYKEE